MYNISIVIHYLCRRIRRRLPTFRRRSQLRAARTVQRSFVFGANLDAVIYFRRHQFVGASGSPSNHIRSGRRRRKSRRSRPVLAAAAVNVEPTSAIPTSVARRRSHVIATSAVVAAADDRRNRKWPVLRRGVRRRRRQRAPVVRLRVTVGQRRRWRIVEQDVDRKLFLRVRRTGAARPAVATVMRPVCAAAAAPSPTAAHGADDGYEDEDESETGSA